MDIRTIVVIGCIRCGTTMLAGLCEILGIPMVGKHYDPEKWEDQELINALKDRDEKTFTALVKLRNNQYKKWGFKCGSGWQFLPLFERCLDRPVYLVIYKDPVSVTWRRFNRCTPGRLDSTINWLLRSVKAIKKAKQPVHLLSYHYAIIKPQAFVTELAELIDVEPNEEQVNCAVEYIQPNRKGPKQHYPDVKDILTAMKGAD